MRPISGYFHLMANTLTVYPFTGYDVFSKPQYGAPVVYKCRLVGKGLSKRPELGAWTAYLGTNNYIHPLSQVWLSTSDTGSTEAILNSPPIKSSIRMSGTDGWHHTVLHL